MTPELDPHTAEGSAREHIAAQLATSAHVIMLAAQMQGREITINQALELSRLTWRAALDQLGGAVARGGDASEHGSLTFGQTFENLPEDD